MLAECAPGHTIKLTTHYYRITFKDLVYATFPKGEHGKSNPPIEFGHVKRLARYFDILDCTKRFLSH